MCIDCSERTLVVDCSPYLLFGKENLESMFTYKKVCSNSGNVKQHVGMLRNNDNFLYKTKYSSAKSRYWNLRKAFSLSSKRFSFGKFECRRSEKSLAQSCFKTLCKMFFEILFSHQRKVLSHTFFPLVSQHLFSLHPSVAQWPDPPSCVYLSFSLSLSFSYIWLSL